MSLESNPVLAGSAKFDGSVSQYIKIEDFKSFPTTEITVECWLKSCKTNKPGTPISYATSQTADAFVLYDVRKLWICINGKRKLNGHSLDDGKWHHLAVTWQSETGEVKVYQDGQPAGSTKVLEKGKPLPHSGGALVFGQEQDEVGGRFEEKQAFEGEMAEVRIWNKAREQAELIAQMDKPLTGDEEHLVGYWPLDEGHGRIAHDKSGNGHHGIAEGIWPEEDVASLINQAVAEVRQQLLSQIHSLPRSIAGSVDRTGKKITGRGWTSKRVCKGTYRITFDSELPTTPVVVASSLWAHENDDWAASNVTSCKDISPSGFTVISRDVVDKRQYADQDAAFSFVAVGDAAPLEGVSKLYLSL